jgi:uncharacterized protein YegJ (DUF2314 family)
MSPSVVDGAARTAERMWVEVKGALPHGAYVGTLANDPEIVTDIVFGDRIEFGPGHVVAIRRRARI